MTANSIKVLGKGQKERLVYFGKRTAKALWKLLTPRLKDSKPDDLVFTVGAEDDLRPMTRDVLHRLLAPKGDIGDRAGVANVYPHRFRHTFAITYLHNDGDLFTLQDLLGHSDMAMVKRYARIAREIPVDRARRTKRRRRWTIGGCSRFRQGPVPGAIPQPAICRRWNERCACRNQPARAPVHGGSPLPRVLLRFIPQHPIASITATAAMSTMSRTSSPACSTWTGAPIPSRIGPIASAPPSRASSL